MKLGAKDQVGENLFRGLVPSFWRKQERDQEKACGLLARFKLDAKKDDYAARCRAVSASCSRWRGPS